MKKSMSKLLALTLLFCMLTSSALAADTLEVASTYTDTVLETYRSIVDAFTAETGIEVDLVTPGSEYETVRKPAWQAEISRMCGKRADGL